MNLYFNTVAPHLKSALEKLFYDDAFADFRLVGGTALSLYRGHRKSIDIDLFTDMEYRTMPTDKIKDALVKLFPYTKYLETFDEHGMVYSVFCGQTKEECLKLDLCYTDKFIYPVVEVGCMRLADIRDLAAMKIVAVDNSNRMKDFWDIHELLEVMPLEKMLIYAEQRDPYGVDIQNVVGKLKNIRNLELDEVDIISLKGVYWEFVLEDLEEEARKL